MIFMVFARPSDTSAGGDGGNIMSFCSGLISDIRGALANNFS
jgi:hypothetical protein